MCQIRWSIYTQVAKIDKRTRLAHVTGFGKDAVMKTESLGWFVRFEGSQEALYYGEEKPEFAEGDRFKITFERIDDANR